MSSASVPRTGARARFRSATRVSSRQFCIVFVSVSALNRFSRWSVPTFTYARQP
jgi:hypothetical protein